MKENKYTGAMPFLDAMAEQKTNYEPYGAEWEAEMKKWSKDLLVGKIRDLLIDRIELKERHEDLIHRYNDLLLMYSIKNKIKESTLDFETEYQLQEFRDIQKDHFDKDGKAFQSVISVHLCERMLKLINQLEIELQTGESEPDRIFRITSTAMDL
jgi:hypothetical protein